MDKFIIRKPSLEQTTNVGQSSKRNHKEINLNELPADPGTRRRMSKCNPNDREKVQRAYLQRGPHQLRGHNFMKIILGILGITNELSLALQRKDQYIVNAMELVGISKQRLTMMRNEGWDSLTKEVYLFCEKYSICIPKRDDVFVARGGPRRVAAKVTNLHHYSNELFTNVVDWVLGELNSRFHEATTELLLCMACLSPDDSFSSFNKDMKSNVHFTGLKGVGHLAAKLVETKKNFIYPLVYQLIKLVLVLPVSRASVERSFSAMKIVKTRLRNKIGDQWLNDCLVTYIEKKIVETVPNESILKRFQKMRVRRFQLPSKYDD